MDTAICQDCGMLYCLPNETEHKRFHRNCLHVAAIGRPYLQYNQREQIKVDAYEMMNGDYALEDKIKAGVRYIEQYYHRYEVESILKGTSSAKVRKLCNHLKDGTALRDWYHQKGNKFIDTFIDGIPMDIRDQVIAAL